MKKTLLLSAFLIIPLSGIECAQRQSISVYTLSAYSAFSATPPSVCPDLAPALMLEPISPEAGTIELRCKKGPDGLTATIRRLYVEPLYRSRGFALALFNAAMEFLINHVGAKSIEWDAVPLDEHTDATRLMEMYKRLGGIIKGWLERGCQMALAPEMFVRLRKEDAPAEKDFFTYSFKNGEVKVATFHHY